MDADAAALPLKSKNSLEKRPLLRKSMLLEDEEQPMDEVVDHSNKEDFPQKEGNVASRRNYACTAANPATSP